MDKYGTEKIDKTVVMIQAKAVDENVLKLYFGLLRHQLTRAANLADQVGFYDTCFLEN